MSAHDPSRGHSPAAIPFSIGGFRLGQFSFSRGLLATYAGSSGGAFGKVLVGRRTKGGIPMAVKVMLAKGTSRQDFQAEGEMLLHIRGKVDAVRELYARGVALTLADRGAHHVAYVYGTGEEADLSSVDAGLPAEPAFLLAVEPLERTLTEGLRPDAEIAALLRAAHEIALALAFLAQHGTVHSDLKPQNVMLAADGCAVLCDLGLGRMMCATGTYDGHGGTLNYLAPELLEKASRAASPATDMYAYGMILWCLFAGREHAWADATGRVPNAGSIVAGVMRGDRPDIRVLRPDTPPAMIDLIQRCWAHEPAARPAALSVAGETEACWQYVSPADELRRLRAYIASVEASAAASLADAKARITAAESETTAVKELSERRVEAERIAGKKQLAEAVAAEKAAGERMLAKMRSKRDAERSAAEDRVAEAIAEERAASERARSKLQAEHKAKRDARIAEAVDEERAAAAQHLADLDAKFTAFQASVEARIANAVATERTAGDARLALAVTAASAAAEGSVQELRAQISTLEANSRNARVVRLQTAPSGTLGSLQASSYAVPASPSSSGPAHAASLFVEEECSDEPTGFVPDTVRHHSSPISSVVHVSGDSRRTSTHAPRGTVQDLCEGSDPYTYASLRNMMGPGGTATCIDEVDVVASYRAAHSSPSHLSEPSAPPDSVRRTYSMFTPTSRTIAPLLPHMHGPRCCHVAAPADDLWTASKTGDLVSLANALRRGCSTEEAQGGHTALIVASSLGHDEAVRLLLEAGADVAAVANVGHFRATALHAAAYTGHANVAGVLLMSLDINVNALTTNQETPLFIAAANGYADVVDALLGCTRVDVNICNESGYTPLIVAAYEGHEDVIRRLLADARVDVNRSTLSGATALMKARKHRHASVAALLQADPRLQDSALLASLAHSRSCAIS